ncbi:MAG: hypothetical protein KY453_04120 [Gemmatimonadetes bacterium]|nr:hypothetical protein [Gemmatimonadota bacterium]
MTRAAVTAVFLLVAALVVFIAFEVGVATGTGELLLNLGVEIMGIVLTVAVVEWFFERRRLQSNARQVAWHTLHAVEHAVWVWQGGPRELETDELLGLLHAVGDDDPVAEFTEALLFNLGTRSKQMLHRDLETVEALPGLMSALEELARLNAIREGRTPMRPEKVASILEDAVLVLAKVLGLPRERMPASLIRYRDPSRDAQAERHFGVGSGQGERTHRSVVPMPSIRRAPGE